MSLQSDRDTIKTPVHRYWWLVLLGIAGICTYFAKINEAFPTASLDIQLPKTKIESLSAHWAEKVGYKKHDTVTTTVFGGDSTARTFLEYELGLPRANILMRNEIPVWYWQTRTYQPSTLEEFSTAISTSGNLVSLSHFIEKERAVQSVSEKDAKQIATDFIENQVKLPLSEFDLINHGSMTQPSRTDHFFTWENKKTEFAGARLRISAQVAGNTINSFGQYLHVPEEWVRKFRGLRSYNQALQSIALIAYYALAVASAFGFLWAFLTGLLRWRFAITLAIMVSGVGFLENLNWFNASLHNYPTNMTYGGYIASVLVSAGIDAITEFLHCLIIVGTAEALYRAIWPDKLALEKIFTRQGLQTKNARTGLIVGHALFGLMAGWLTVYYVLGRKFGIWCPLGLSNTEVLSSYFPFFSGMEVGIHASIIEEFLYRVLALSLIYKLSGNFWLSNIIQALAWGFAHSSYPQEPPWARGVELSASGIVIGAILRYFGLLPCLAAHYILDAFLTVEPLLKSSVAELQITALITILPFSVLLAISCYLWQKHGEVSAPEKLLNKHLQTASKAAPVEQILEEHNFDYAPLPSRLRKLIGLIAAIALVAGLSLHFSTPAEQIQVRLDRNKIIEIARSYLHRINPTAKAHRAAAKLSISTPLLTLQFLRENVDHDRFYALLKNPAQLLMWNVRFFTPMSPEAYRVYVDMDGRPLGVFVSRQEDEKGVRLTKTQATNLITKYLNSDYKELEDLHLDDVSKTVRKNRTDYTLRFDDPKYKVGEAKFKVSATLTGDQISGPYLSWQIPDQWTWNYNKLSFRRQMMNYLIMACSFFFSVLAIIWFFGILRSGAVRWRPVLLIGLATGAMWIPLAANDCPVIFYKYPTDMPIHTFFTSCLAGEIGELILSTATVCLSAAAALGSWRIMFPRLSISNVIGTSLLRPKGTTGRARRNIWLDALTISYTFAFLTVAFNATTIGVTSRVSPQVVTAPRSYVAGFANVWSPTLDGLAVALMIGIAATIAASICVGLYARYIGSFRIYLLIATATCLIYPSFMRYWQDYVFYALQTWLLLLVLWFFICRLARQNILAYFLTGALSYIAFTIYILATHMQHVYLNHIYILTMVFLSPLAYLYYLYLSSPGYYADDRNDGDNGQSHQSIYDQ